MPWMAAATGIFMVWRSVGLLALLYTAIFISIPRAYLGFHYPTDLLAGSQLASPLATTSGTWHPHK